jgi:hypothetical protein
MRWRARAQVAVVGLDLVATGPESLDIPSAATRKEAGYTKASLASTGAITM